MKTFTHQIIAILTLLTVTFSASSQTVVCVSIENEQVIAGAYVFDIYLNTTAASTAPLYLADSDFMLTFAAGNFSSPVLSKVSTTCTLVPTNTSGINPLIVQSNYATGTAVSILGDNLRINLAAPASADPTAFRAGMARVDEVVSTHRLGRFSISGYNGSGATLGWRTTGALRTLVYTKDSVTFNTSLVTLVTKTTVLPVAWSSFDAIAIAKDKVQLNWMTSLELNNEHFEIEKSYDSQIFSKIGSQFSQGGENGHSYTFTDHEATASRMFYRIRQVDINGNFSFSKVIEINMAAQQPSLSLYPNPAQDQISIRLSDETAYAQLQLFDMSGKVVLSQDWNQPAATLQIDISHLPTGIYTWMMLSDQHAESGKVQILGSR